MNFPISIFFLLLTVFESIKPTSENDGIIFIMMNNGKEWKNISTGLPNKISIGLGGIISSDNLLSIATKEQGIYTFQEKNNSWIHLPTNQFIIDGNIGPLIHFKKGFYIGTQKKGVFFTDDKGKIWETINKNLKDFTIRRFLILNNQLHVCTNSGFYQFNEKLNSWNILFSQPGLQVNGATLYNNAIYIATNKGVYKQDKNGEWNNILLNNSVHNISSDNQRLYAMTYTSLLLSSMDGINWQKTQAGLPKDLYTFNVLNNRDTIYAGQWDGIYKKTNQLLPWIKWSNGLPENFAATNLIQYKGTLVITTSEKRLK